MVMLFPDVLFKNSKYKKYYLNKLIIFICNICNTLNISIFK